MTDIQKCAHCDEQIRPNQTGGWYHVETSAHRSDQRCFLYASPEPVGSNRIVPGGGMPWGFRKVGDFNGDDAGPLDEYRGQ